MRTEGVVAVHGNDDSPESQRELPFQQLIVVAGHRILLSHGHSPDPAEERARRQDDAWAPKLARLAAATHRSGASVVVSGHTHIPIACRQDGVLVVNPGAIAAPSSLTRQTVQTVAILSILQGEEPRVVHVDLATSDRLFVPDVDWNAGFRATHDQFSTSILDPELATDWPRIESLARETDFEPFLRALQRVAHRVWAGEVAAITRAALIREIEREASLPEVRRHAVDEVIESLKESRRGNRLDSSSIRDAIDEGRR